eukprot:9025131-Pyramimonas_sp.AAC.1
MAFWSDSGLSGHNSYVDSRLKSQERRSGTIQDQPDVTVRLIRCVSILRMVFGALQDFHTIAPQQGASL